ncbi:uncharacterized protein UMAG_11839 [Mycosarcoma maydis]|uniref:Uncharacterized protein n=1 Tax=Mycosarcoma maydis TaxID=5270 RepID=A0A0D1E997_MYCMD|nr:uncharacterized protein UMAG_11839 [Ustilago maydis 521]KIS70960.1 hypothetical protein UMAG_11839 [Ustilago maydis 521]|eukprot:XP_011387454.1 hypothetical protein UMAG_11839 [Ustilago maydis 521]
MKLTSSFATLASVVVIALCVGQTHADSVTTPLGLTRVDDKGKPITPLTYLNLAPASKELADAAKMVTTPPPMIEEQRRLLPSDHLEPVVEQFSSKGITIKRELGGSLVPSLPILGALDNEGDHSNQVSPATDSSVAGEKRLLDALNSLKPGEGTQFLPENHQTLGQRTVHPLNRRSVEEPIDVSILGKKLSRPAMPKVPARRDESSGLDLLGTKIPLNSLPIDSLPLPKPPTKRDESSGLDLLGTKIPLNSLPIDSLPLPKPPTKRDESSGLDLLGTKIPLNSLPIDSLPLPKPPTKRDESSGLDLFGTKIPLNSLPLDSLPLPGASKRDVQPVDLGLKTGNKGDLDSAEALLKGLLPIKREEDSVQPFDLGLKTGNEQDLERAKSLIGGLLGGSKRDSISPDGVNLGSVKDLGSTLGQEAMKNGIPLALSPVKQAASPAVQGISTVNQVCTSFGCAQIVKGAIDGATKNLGLPEFQPIRLPVRSLGEKNLFADGLLHNNGQVSGIPVKRASEDPVVSTILDTSDKARDALLGVKDAADNAAGGFVKNMYSKPAEVETKRDLSLPPFSLLPGKGPDTKAAAKELIEFLDLPVPGLKRMDKVRRKE